MYNGFMDLMPTLFNSNQQDSSFSTSAVSEPDDLDLESKPDELVLLNARIRVKELLDFLTNSFGMIFDRISNEDHMRDSLRMTQLAGFVDTTLSETFETDKLKTIDDLFTLGEENTKEEEDSKSSSELGEDTVF